jgi:D-3-phosphoglycerate dehydrogenase
MMVFQARNHFNGKPGSELKGKKLGIQAYGHVGKNVARIAKGFDMAVCAFDPFVSKESIEADGVEVYEDLEKMYADCDYISLHIPANQHTIKSINYALLSKMKKGATLVNTARKEVIDEEGLLKMFQDRDDFKYISDIAPDNREVIEKDFADRCFFTPKKMGAQTAEANINAGIAAAKQIIAFFEKGDTTFKVN